MRPNLAQSIRIKVVANFHAPSRSRSLRSSSSPSVASGPPSPLPLTGGGRGGPLAPSPRFARFGFLLLAPGPPPPRLGFSAGFAGHAVAGGASPGPPVRPPAGSPPGLAGCRRGRLSRPALTRPPGLAFTRHPRRVRRGCRPPSPRSSRNAVRLCPLSRAQAFGVRTRFVPLHPSGVSLHSWGLSRPHTPNRPV